MYMGDLRTPTDTLSVIKLPVDYASLSKEFPLVREAFDVEWRWIWFGLLENSCNRISKIHSS